MPAYDAILFDPPAPVATVALRNPRNGAESTGVPLLLDTGADVTLLPRASVVEIGVATEPGAGYELASFDGSTSFADSVELDLIFLEKSIRGRYLLYDQDYGILGRDVLNLVSLHLDGPSSTWRELSRPAES